MTKTDWFKSPYYFIRTNDVIVVKPNGPKVKTAGHVTNIGTLTSLFSVALSIFLLLTR
jgi:polysaccharide export outer membrane protein